MHFFENIINEEVRIHYKLVYIIYVELNILNMAEDRILKIDINKEMKSAYIDYSIDRKSVV